MTGYEALGEHWRRSFGTPIPLTEAQYRDLKAAVVRIAKARDAEINATGGDAVFASLGGACFLIGALAFMAATGDIVYADRHPDHRTRVEVFMLEAARAGAMHVQQYPPEGLGLERTPE